MILLFFSIDGSNEPKRPCFRAGTAVIPKPSSNLWAVRAKEVSKLLNAGVGVLLFDADAVWRKDLVNFSFYFYIYYFDYGFPVTLLSS